MPPSADIPRYARGLGCAFNGALARRVAAAGAKRPCPRSPTRWRSPTAPCFQRSVVRLGWPCGGGRAPSPLSRWRLPVGRRPRWSLRSLTWSISRRRWLRGASLPPQSPRCAVASHPLCTATAPVPPLVGVPYAVRTGVGRFSAYRLHPLSPIGHRGER